MNKVNVIFGSTTGNTEMLAQQIAAAFETAAINIADASAADFDAELLIIGSSTWGLGELQDDWQMGIAMLESANLSGKNVALFGCGDQSGFGDTFCDAVSLLRDAAKSAGATIVGATSIDGYTHSSSLAEQDGEFCGLLIDYDNDSDKVDERLSGWIANLKNI